MNEAAFWSSSLRPLLVRTCRQMGLRSHFERVENMVSVGTPDVDYCIASVHGKLELKYTPKDAARSSTPVLGLGHGMRRSQIVWAVRRMHSGGRVLLCVGTPSVTWLLRLWDRSPETMRAVEMMSRDQLNTTAVWCSSGDKPSTLVELLMEPVPPYTLAVPETQKGNE